MVPSLPLLSHESSASLKENPYRKKKDTDVMTAESVVWKSMLKSFKTNSFRDIYKTVKENSECAKELDP